MLRSIDEMDGYVLQATDGEIGRCKDFLFDDGSWVIRWMVADTGKWIPGRRVLVSPVSLGVPDWSSRRFHVMLTKDEVEGAPSLSEDEPVSRQYEAEIFRHRGYTPYWGGAGLWGLAAIPSGLREGGAEAWRDETVLTQELPQGDPHLRSVDEVTGYGIRAKDGEIGHVEDFIVDDESWVIRYVVVDTRKWLPGRKVLVLPSHVRALSVGEREAEVDLTREQVKASPEYEPDRPITRAYESRLYDVYGRAVYWE